MVHFKRKQGPAPYLNQRAQIRMLGLVLGLCLIVVGISWASRPASWYWLIPPKAKLDSQISGQQKSKKPGGGDGYTVLSPEEFIALGEKEAGEQKEGAGKKEAVEKTSDSKKSLFEGVDDNRFGIQSSDLPILLRLLRELKTMKGTERSERRQPGIGYPHLISQPEVYRGALILIEGSVVRIRELSVPGNNDDVEMLYDVWISTYDSGKNLYRVLVPVLPAELLGKGKNEEAVAIQLEAAFLKRFEYQSQNGNQSAPLLIASKIELMTSPSRVDDGSLVPYLLGGAVAVVVILGLVMWYHRREDGRFHQREKEQRNAEMPEKFELNAEIVEAGEATIELE